MSLLTQAIIFAVMLATGLALGLWFDLFRFINCRGRWAPFLDLLLWAAATCAVFVVLMNVNYLELRFYVFLSLTLGLLLYFKLFSRHVLHLYRFLLPLYLGWRSSCGGCWCRCWVSPRGLSTGRLSWRWLWRHGQLLHFFRTRSRIICPRCRTTPERR